MRPVEFAMQLRPKFYLPSRYRENDISPLPGIAAFVRPTITFNPNLPPAAFPTLDKPCPVDTRTADAMTMSSRPESPGSDLERESLPKRATVFHGEMRSSSKPLREVFSVKWAEVAAPDPVCRLQSLDSLGGNCNVPEYDGYGVMGNDNGGDGSPRIGLTVSLINFLILLRSHLT